MPSTYLKRHIDDRIMQQAKGQAIGSTGDTELRRMEEYEARTAAQCEVAHRRAVRTTATAGQSRASLKRKRKRKRDQQRMINVPQDVPGAQPPPQPTVAPIAQSLPVAGNGQYNVHERALTQVVTAVLAESFGQSADLYFSSTLFEQT